jgi:hypothetical protein
MHSSHGRGEVNLRAADLQCIEHVSRDGLSQAHESTTNDQRRIKKQSAGKLLRVMGDALS